jgi:hypothetical protein
MPWVKIDDHFDEHPKMQQVGPVGWGFWLAGLAYCNRNLTDGFIPWSKAKTLCSFQVAEDDGTLWELARSSGYAAEDLSAEWVIGLLIDAGLWEEVENGKGRIDGYRIHDYSEYQPSKEQVLAERSANADRQSRFRDSKRNANSNAVTNATVTEKKRQRNEPPVPVPVPVPQEEPNGSSVSAADATDSPDPVIPDDPPEDDIPPKPAPDEPMPRNGTAQTMLAVLYEDVLQIGPPTNYRQAVGQASRFEKAGATVEDVERIAYWLLADPWQADKGITITTVINSRDKWKSAQNAPRESNGSLTVHRGGNTRPTPGKRGYTGDELLAMSRASPDDDSASSIFGNVIDVKGRLAR